MVQSPFVGNLRRLFIIISDVFPAGGLYSIDTTRNSLLLKSNSVLRKRRMSEMIYFCTIT